MFDLLPSRASHREEIVRNAAAALYARGAELYLRYRRRRGMRMEDAAWLAVDQYVRQHRLSSAHIVDLGCGSGSSVLAGWSPSSYVGYDLSAPLLREHILAGRRNVMLRQIDLEAEPPAPAATPNGEQLLVLSVLALHYLSDPSKCLQSFAAKGRSFCLLVPNAEYDAGHIGADNLVHLNRGAFEFVYFPYKPCDYIKWLGQPRVVMVQPCGAAEGEDPAPYLLIGGRW